MHAVGASADMPQRTTCDISTQTELQHKLDICVQTDHFIECNSHCANSCNYSSAFDELHLFENSKENEVLSPIAIEDLELIENQTVDSSLNDGENAETPTESEESIVIEYEGVFTDTPIEYNGGIPEVLPMIMLYIMTAGPAQWGLVQSSSNSTIPYKFVKIVYS